jgi:biotin carboxylase
MAEGVLLVLGSGHQQFREYLLAAAAATAPVWLFDPTGASWQRPYVRGSTALDVFDPDTAVRAARRLAADVPVLGVLCWHEGVILSAAHVAESLRLPGPGVDAVRACRDKSRTRVALRAAGIPQPEFALASTVDDTRTAADRIGYPLVLKPLSLGASQGVVAAAGPDELPWALAVARDAHQAGMTNTGAVLVEQYVPGPEISVDAVVADGAYRPFALARKRLGAEPFFEETGHIVDAADPLLADGDLLTLLADTHRALGWRTGITHAEVKLGPDGPVLIEVNGRLGGDLIPYLGRLATGIDPGRVGAQLALGVEPDLTPAYRTAVGIRFLVPDADCRVRSVRLPAPAGALVEAVSLVEPGTELRLPPDGYVSRWAYLIARDGDPATCAAALDAAATTAALESEPLTAAGRA